MKNALLIVSVLDGNGPTGVEAHFNQIIQQAKAYDIDARLVSRYPSDRLWSKFATLARRLFTKVNRERALIFDAWIQARVIEGKLLSALAASAGKGYALTICAQDPLSAKVALKAKRRYHCRVVTVIHYNISVADELVMKGEARKHGPLWHFAVQTERTTLPYVDKIIFVSDFMRRVVLERLPAIVNVPHTVIPNFIGAPLAPEPHADYDADIIAIGTLEPRKNQAFLLRVLARANALGCRYTLTLVGHGPDEKMLRALARELGVEEQVVFAGFRTSAANLISRHRVLAHAARIENMPITLIEALAAGRPILAPAVGGITEIFNDTVEGFHWPLDDVDAAAAVLIRILSDEATYDRLSRAALVRYHSKFNSDMLVCHWLTALLNSHGANHASWQKRMQAA